MRLLIAIAFFMLVCWAAISPDPAIARGCPRGVCGVQAPNPAPERPVAESVRRELRSVLIKPVRVAHEVVERKPVRRAVRWLRHCK